MQKKRMFQKNVGMEAKQWSDLSISDYLRLEQEANVRYEYHEGRIVAMAGGTLEHGLISGNVFGELKLGIREQGVQCTAINSEVKLLSMERIYEGVSLKSK